MKPLFGPRPARRSGPSAAAPRDRSAAPANFVGDQHQRHAALGVLGEQEIDDLLAGRLIEIAGGLVRHQDGGIGRQRARERDALLLAAGQLRRIVMQAVAESDRAKFLRRAPRRIGIAGELQRHRDILQRRHGRDQMEGLEHDADLTAAKPRQRILVEALKGVPLPPPLRCRDAPAPPSPSEAWIFPIPTARSGRSLRPAPREG